MTRSLRHAVRAFVLIGSCVLALLSSAPAQEAVNELPAVEGYAREPAAPAWFAINDAEPTITLISSFNVGDQVTAIAFAHDARVALLGTRGGKLQLWNLEAQRLARELARESKQPVKLAALSPDGAWVAAVGEDSNAQVWSLPDGKQKTLAHSARLADIAFPLGRNLLATVTVDRQVRIWNLETGKAWSPAIEWLPNERVSNFGFVGDRLAIGMHVLDLEKRVWEVSQAAKNLPGGVASKEFDQVRSNSTGTWIAVHAKGTPWNAFTSPAGRTFLVEGPDFKRQTESTHYLDENFRFEVSKDQTLYVWSKDIIEILEPQRPIRRHLLRVPENALVTIHADQHLLASAEGDGKLKLWRLPPKDPPVAPPTNPNRDPFKGSPEIIGRQMGMATGADLALGTVQAQTKQAIAKKDPYPALEELAQRFRVKREKLPDGSLKLQFFYQLLGDQQVKFDEWRKAYPESPTPLLGQAFAAIRQGWQARGGGFANTVTEEGWRTFDEKTKLAQELLEAAEKLEAKDPDLYRLQLVVARARAWPRKDAEDVIERLQKVDPLYTPAYVAMAEYLLPRWHGEPGDVEAFAAKTAERLKGNDGEDGQVMYARIAWIVAQYERRDFFGTTKFEYDTLKKACAALEKRDPIRVDNVMPGLFFACMAQDADTANRLFPLVGKTNTQRILGQHYPRVINWAVNSVSARPAGPGEKILADHAAGVHDVAFSPDGRQLASYGSEMEGPTVRLWNVAEGTLIRALGEPYPEPAHERPRERLAFSPDGQWLAYASPKELTLVKRTGDQEVKRIEGRCERIVFAPDSSVLLVLGGPVSNKPARMIRLPNFEETPLHTKGPLGGFLDGGKSYIAGITTFEQIQTKDHRGLARFHCPQIIEMVMHPDQVSFVGVTMAQSVVRWHAPKRAMMSWKDAPKSRSLAVSPDGRLLVVAIEYRIEAWELETGRVLHTFEGHGGLVNSVAISPDGKTLASGSRDKMVRLWDLSPALSKLEPLKQ